MTGEVSVPGDRVPVEGGFVTIFLFRLVRQRKKKRRERELVGEVK